MTVATEPTAEELQRKIDELQAELAALPRQITTAAASGDDAKYTRLAGRRAVLPAQIKALKLTLEAQGLRAQIAEHEAALARFDARAAVIGPEYTRLMQEKQRVDARLNELSLESSSIGNNRSNFHEPELRRLRRLLDGIEAELTGEVSEQ